MIENIKKAVYAGIGATLVTKDKVEDILNEFVDKGKINSKEASELAEKIAEQSKKEFSDATDNLNNMLEGVLQKANFATQTQLKELEERIKQLEGKS